MILALLTWRSLAPQTGRAVRAAAAACAGLAFLHITYAAAFIALMRASGLQSLHADMIEAIRTHYVLRTLVPGHWVYAPRPNPAAAPAAEVTR